MLHRRRAVARRPVPAVAAVELPTVNMLVRLVPPQAAGTGVAAGPGGLAGAEGVADAGLASRVEDVRAAGPEGAVHWRVAVPDYPGDLVDAGDGPGGEPWAMSWVTEQARWELPVRRAPGEGSGPRSWWLTAAGPVRRCQRRRFYRAGTCVPVELDELCDPYRTLVGRSLDVSEGGLRCVVPLPGGDEVVPGTRVLVRVALEGVDSPLAGVVRRSRRPAPSVRVAGWHREVAVAFDDPDRYGDAVRGVVVRLQVRARRLGPPGAR